MMSHMKATIENAAEMLSLGYTEHEVIRILRIPANMAEDLINQAEMWNDEYGAQQYTDDDLQQMAEYYGEE